MLHASSSPRKRRTRGHVIADLAVNHVERQALLCGYSIERIVHDYGVDASLFTYDRRGQTESVWIPLQIKATDNVHLVEQGQFISIRVERSDLRSWLIAIFPVILIMYDERKDRAYWLYLQAHFGAHRFRVSRGAGKHSIRIPIGQVLDPSAIERFADYRNAILAQLEGKVEHDD